MKNYTILKLALTLLLIVSSANLTEAQTRKMSGIVADSLGMPLAMGNVIAYQQDKNLGAFGITNDQGKYQLLNLHQDSTYTVKVSFLGLKTVEYLLKPTKEDVVKNFIMLSGADELDAINLTYEMPVTIKGDTITYNSDSFTNGTEDKLGDVLNKLPGVEVNDDGDIQVEGKTVEKVMVEGKDFFEGDSRLATKNIPADAVKKVQVLKNYNNQRQLKGLGNDEDRIVINIKLKEGKKKFWFGEATVGAGYGGNEERFLVQPKAFYYSENFSMNILTDFNNLGVPAFTGRDYYRFVGFNRRDTRQNNSSINVAPVTSFSPVATNRALSIESDFGAVNSSWSLGDKIDMSAFAILSSTRTASLTNSRNIFIDSGLTETTSDQADEVARIGLFKLGGSYNPNDNLSINYDGRFNISDESQASDFISSRQELVQGTVTDVVEDIGQRNSQNPISINQSLDMYYTATDKDIIAVEARYLNQDEDPFYNAVRDRRNDMGQPEIEPFNGRLGLQQADPYNINQERFIHTNKLDAKVDYWRVLNKKSNINLTAGTVISSQNYSTDIFQILNNGDRDELQDPSLRNDDVQYDFRDLYAAVHYKFITGKFTFTPGVTAHSFQTQDEQRGVTNTINTERILPDLNIRYNIRSSETLTFTANQNVVFNDINDYAQGLVFDNYNVLFSGNNQLEGAINDRLRLAYNKFDMFNYTTVFANVTYERRRDAIQATTILDGINQTTSSINAALANEFISGFAAYGKEFGKIQAGINANVNYSTFNNIINNRAQESVNFTQTYGLTARSNWKDGINFDARYTLSLNDSDNGRFENNSTTHRINLDADWQLGKRWIIRAGYDYNLFNATGGVENTFEFLDASIEYSKPSSRWEYSLLATNLLNVDSNVNNTFGQIATSTRETFVLPRYVYFRIRFDL